MTALVMLRNLASMKVRDPSAAAAGKGRDPLISARQVVSAVLSREATSASGTGAKL
jgi:hypothetical protein